MTGARFGEVRPRTGQGLIDTAYTALDSSAEGLLTGRIAEVTPLNAFRLGQQIIFWLSVYNPVVTIDGDEGSANWITRIRLLPWWARPNLERRQAFAQTKASPTPAGSYPVDMTTFGGVALADNRVVWVPSPKRLDITPFGIAPPAVPAIPYSDSVFLQDVWAFDLPDPTDAAWTAKFAADQSPARWDVFFYPAMGYALGFTYEVEYENVPEPGVVATPIPQLSLQWVTGTLGGNAIQESIG